MKKEAGRHDIFLVILAILFFLWVGIMLLKAYQTEGRQISLADESHYSCRSGWLDESGKEVDFDTLSYSRDDLEKVHVYRYRIPDDCTVRDGDSICFFCRGIDYKIYISPREDRHLSFRGGKRLIHDYSQNGAGLTGKDIGLTIQTVPVYGMIQDCEISLAVTPHETSAFLMDVRIQKTSEFILSTIRSRMWMFVQSIAIAFFGIATILYTFFAVNRRREDKTLLYAWGSLALILGLLLVLQTHVLQFLTGKPEFYNALKYALVLLVTFPQAVQADAAAMHPHRHYSAVVGIVVAVLMIIEAAVCFFWDVSLYRLLIISSLPLLLLNFLMMFIYLVKDYLYSRKKPEAIESVMLLAIMNFLSAIAFTDILIYARSSRHLTDWGRLIRISYIVFVIAMLVVFLRTSKRRNREAKLAEKYRMQSRTDAMTGLMNKGAYLEKEAELTNRLFLARKKGKKLSFVVMALDLNNLKKVNDHLGHNMGDQYIITASRIISEAIGKDGEIYRVGGDEFLILLFGSDPEATYRTVTARLMEKADAYNSENKSEIPLSFAYGHSICTSEQHHSIHDSERAADAEMYEHKRQMKAER